MAASSETSLPTAGWYADPGGRYQYRYWNGTTWTDRVADNSVRSDVPRQWAPPSTAATARRDPDRESGPPASRFQARIRGTRTLWAISTIVFLVLTVGYLLLPVSEAASSIDGTRTVSLSCGSVLSPHATATSGARFINESAICNAARHSNEIRVILFGALAAVSLLLAAFSIVTAARRNERASPPHTLAVQRG